MEMPANNGQDQAEGELSFEEAFTRLDETVKALDSGGLTLESATGLYERGMHLVQVCNRLLNDAELKVIQLKDAYSDQGEVRFDQEDDNDEDED